MAHEPGADHARWLMEQWTAALATAIESMTEERPPVEFAPSGPAEAGAAAAAPAHSAPASGMGTLCWEQGYTDIQQPTLWVTAVESTWMELGARTPGAAGIETAEPAGFAQHLSLKFGPIAGRGAEPGAPDCREVTPEHGVERKQAERRRTLSPPPWAAAGRRCRLKRAHRGLMRALDAGAAETLSARVGARRLRDIRSGRRGNGRARSLRGSRSHTVSHKQSPPHHGPAARRRAGGERSLRPHRASHQGNPELTTA